jgi:L-alanine-DL-glutamate epimerase-like enolase superfamily enzyme
MSSKIKWGGIVGLVAAALLVVSAILNLTSPIQQTYDSTATYLYLGVTVAAYIAVVVAVLGIHALHSGMPRYGLLGTTGAVLTIAAYVIIIRARLLPWWCGVLLIVAFPLGDVANAIFSSAENLLLALLWGSMGVALLSRRRGVAEAFDTARRDRLTEGLLCESIR